MATCTELEAAATEGSEICGLLEGVGTGTAALLDAIKTPVGVFLLFLGVAAGALGLYAAINQRVKQGAK